MSLILAALAAASAAACMPSPITLEEGKALALAAPNVIASARRLRAHPAVEVEEVLSGGWALRVYATDPCANGQETCSSLIGYYSVGSMTADVTDNAIERDIHGYALSKLQARLRKEHCL